MKKKLRLFVAGALFALALSGCYDNNSNQTDENTSEATTEMTTEAAHEGTTEQNFEEKDNSEMVLYSNSGGTYTLSVDNYVEFVETTTHSTSNVNNEDGLEINHSDVYITIQRYPINNILYTTVEDFYKFIDGDSFLSMVVAENAVDIDNEAIVECKNQTVKMESGTTVFVGYLYYFRTNEGFYKGMISGSDSDVVEHYKNFVNNMTFK